MMTDDDRKRVLWLLKKYSSYILWNSWSDAFHAFTDEWEYAARHAAPPLDADDFWVEALKGFWEACSCFDQGLSRLKHGDRHIFRSRNNWQIFEQLRYLDRLMDETEYVHDWMTNKDAIKQRYLEQDSLAYGPGWITEAFEGHPAARNEENVFRTPRYPFKLDYVQFNFPSNLESVPAPSGTTVDSGQEVPLSGIWEPEWQDASMKKSRVVGIRSLFTPIEPRDLRKGCMNYLVSGSVAPPYQKNSGVPIMPVRWRLIWEDTRYKDGVIPAEEAEYLAPAQQASSSRQDINALRAKAGDLCPRAGIWKSIDANGISRRYKDGEPMADLGSSYGLTIWQWEK